MTRILLALLSALLLVLSFPTFDFNFLVWFALVPLLLALKDAGLFSAFVLSWMGGTAFFIGVFYWISFVDGVTLIHFFILVVYLGSYFALFGILLSFVSRTSKYPLIFTAPFLWVTTEYLRGHAGFMALPFGQLVHTQYLNLPLLQMASFTGSYGISFIIMLANAAIADLIIQWINRSNKRVAFGSRYNPLYGGLVVFSIIAIVWVVGYISMPSASSGKRFSVAVTQGNIPQEMKWKRENREYILSRYESLSLEAAKSKPQLIVWPEASTPGFILSDGVLGQRMVAMVQRFNTYLLAGSAEYPKFGERPIKLKSGNTALFFSPEGRIIGQYLKIRLLAFGEYVPYEGIIPWPEFIVRKGTNSNVSGTKVILFEPYKTKLGTLICWEVMFPELSRWFVKEGAEFLVNISNEAAFGESPFPYQFLAACILRAVENRVNLIRATNTGISCFIDPYGRLTERLMKDGKDIFVEGTLTREITLSPAGTFYTRYGDILAYGCIVFSIGLLIYCIFRKRLKKKEGCRVLGR